MRQSTIRLLTALLWLCIFSTRQSEAELFTRVQPSPLTTSGGETTGFAWGDFDNDGDPDVVLASLAPATYLFRNVGQGNFSQEEAGSLALSALSAAFGDFDNDGDLDLFLGSTTGDRIFRNDGGAFSEVTSFPEAQSRHYPISATWVDYDGDGWLDVFVTTGSGTISENDILYRNEGNGTFRQVITGPLVTSPGYSMGSSFADYDGDGWLDVVVPNTYGPNFLLHNDGHGGFTRVETTPITTDPGYGVGSAWGDFDNDGDLDLFITKGGTESNALYRNDGNGVFVKETAAGVGEISFSTGAAWGDYDNDGWLDLAVANRLKTTFLYHNNGDRTFSPADEREINSTYTDANGVSLVDYDNDGFLDLFVAAWAGEGGPNTEDVYHNKGNSNTWLKVNLVGTASNRMGVGAKVRVKTVLQGRTHSLLRQIGGFDSLGSGTLDAHFGLGGSTNVPELTVEWPSGVIQTATNIPVNRTITLEEALPAAVALRIEPQGRLFTNKVDVSISAEPIVTLRYTLDGTDPSPDSPLYREPIWLRAAATVRARAYVGRLAVGDVISASFARVYAYDGDGLPRNWRVEYFGENFQITDRSVDAGADPDTDGATNLQEFVAGTNPVDPASVLRAQARLVPEISWPSVPKLQYQLWRYSVGQAGLRTKVGAPIVATDTVTSFIDRSATNAISLYAVEVVPAGE